MQFEYVKRQDDAPEAKRKKHGFRRILSYLIAIPLLVGAGSAYAHSFGTPYNLPVPLWLYAYGASATLAVSFAIVAYFAGIPVNVERMTRTSEVVGWRIPVPLIGLLRATSVGLLIATIATGLFGTQNVYTNFNMTFFWLIFALGLLYLTALIGDLFALINPWRVLCDWFVAVARRPASGTSYPAWLAYYPALVLYAAYIWIELFGHSQPFSLAVALIAYTALNFGGAALFGRDAWFRYAEFFAVMFRLVALMAPIAYHREDDGSYAVRYRKPLVGLLEQPAEHLSLLLFILFMLSSTAFDGLHETLPWVSVFWKYIFPVLTAGSAQPYTVTVNYYYYWQWAMLLISPFVYLVIYLVFIVASKTAAGSAKGARALALAFAMTVVPIAFVYNATHYFTLLVSQGLQIVRLISDPFGIGWNLFGTATLASDPVILDAGTVWHVQVALILLGHILGVYVSHVEALRMFRGTRRALASQLPMLILMILFTIVGLWILSLPIAGSQVIQPPPT